LIRNFIDVIARRQQNCVPKYFLDGSDIIDEDSSLSFCEASEA